MRPPLTADERERRVIEYLLTLHKGQIAEFRLTRLNRVANFRRALKELLEEFIEARAEVLAASMIEEYAPRRPRRKRASRALAGRRAGPRARKPVWVEAAGRAAVP